MIRGINNNTGINISKILAGNRAVKPASGIRGAFNIAVSPLGLAKNRPQALERIIQRIKIAQLPLEKKKMLLRWVSAAFKQSGGNQDSAGSTSADSLEKKIYELITVMEQVENFKMAIKDYIRDAKEIDKLAEELWPADNGFGAQDFTNFDKLQSLYDSLRNRLSLSGASASESAAEADLAEVPATNE